LIWKVLISIGFPTAYSGKCFWFKCFLRSIPWIPLNKCRFWIL
jgi:hypothetical protein